MRERKRLREGEEMREEDIWLGEKGEDKVGGRRGDGRSICLTSDEREADAGRRGDGGG